jgi:hypothetical protein
MAGLRVTLGERLGGYRDVAIVHQPKPVSDETEGAPEYVELELAGPVVKLAQCRSATLPFGAPFERPDDDGPARVRGEMVWTHKTAPTLVIEGRPGMTADEYAAGRRR